MYALLITFSLFMGVSATLHYGMTCSVTVSLVSGVVVALLAQIGIGLLVRKKITAVMTAMQVHLQESAEAMRRKYEGMAQRGGNTKLMMAQAEKEQHGLFQEAIDASESLRKYGNWTLLLDRQIATIQFQFYYQMKNFKKTDEMMKKIFIADPMGAAMKMTRLYQQDNMKEVEKAYKKYTRKFRSKGVILYALMAWIYVKKDNVDAAIKVLLDAKQHTGDPILLQNLQCLQNAKIKQFSNAPFNEQWYALYLEQPKQMQGQPAHAQAIHPMHRQMMAGGMHRHR